MSSAQRSVSNEEFSKPTISSSPSSLLKITILLVDDDSTSLAIISAMLKEWRYEVATVKTPIDALSTLRAHPGIDLVVTDLHMPEMNGIELQRQINREFKVPVIIMSSDDKESVMLKSLEGGAVFFIVKPVKPDDLKNVWQYAIAAKKSKSVVIEEIGSIEEESSLAGKLSNGETASVSSANDETNDAKRGCKRKASSKKGKDDQEEETATSRKKTKVVWTNSLHNQFLEALRHLGLEKAVPKKILEHMNVQSLTRENVASHLQKYRIFLKRVAERNCFSSKALVERFLKSSFASGHPFLVKTAQEYSRLAQLQQMRGLTFQPCYGGSISTHNAASLGPICFPSQNAPSSKSVQQQQGFGQTRLLSNLGNKRLVSGNTNPLYQGNGLGFANGSNLSLNSGFSGGLFNASNGLMNDANSMHKYQQQIQARPDFYSAGSLSQFKCGSPSFHSSNSTLATGSIGTISTYSTLNSGYTNNNSYAGIRLTTDGQLTGMGQTRLNGVYGLSSRTCKENMNVAAMGNQTFHHMAEGGSPSTGLVGINKISQTYTAANQQANSSRLPGFGIGGASDYNSDHLLNNASFDNTTLSQQLGGQGYLSDVLVESKNYKFPYQQQAGGEGVHNPEFSSSSIFPEIYPSLDELLNSDFSDSLSLEETSPCNEQALGQVQSGNNEKLMDTGIIGGAHPSDESYPTKFNQNTSKQQRGGEQLTHDSELSSLFQVNNALASGEGSSNNQNWVDDFLDSLFSFGPAFE